MLNKEVRAVLSIGSIMTFRMLGLFMILPIFAVAAAKIPGANSTLIGMALGIYGLTQACLQIPFGNLSDRIGRRPVILLGLLLFAFGSIVAAMAHSIQMIIVGRALQGAGAIGSTCLALVADLTRDENRTKAMASIGMIFGLSFLLAIILGPLINAHYGLAGIFWITAILSGFAIILLYTLVPQPPKLLTPAQHKPYKTVFANPQLWRMNFSILVQHALLTLLFLVLPSLLQQAQLSLHQQTIFYLIILVLAFFAMVPFIIIAEKKRQMKKVMQCAVAVMLSSQILFLSNHTASVTSLAIGVFLFFTAFTLLESILPSLVSKIAPLNIKGTAMGVYSTSQFLGIFIGGSAGGLLMHRYHQTGVFIFAILLLLLWLYSLATMKQPPYGSTMIFKLPSKIISNTLQQTLAATTGVYDVAIIAEEQLIYIKADKTIIDKNGLRNLIESANLN